MKNVFLALLLFTMVGFGQLQQPQLLKGTANGNVALTDSTKVLGFGVDTDDYGFKQEDGVVKVRHRGGEWYGIPDSGRAVDNSYQSVGLNGTNQYMGLTYAVSDSFLNMNGYERTLLPQSTMKIGFDSTINTETFAADSGKWQAINTTTTTVGSKFRFTLAASTEDSSGVGMDGTYKVLAAGKRYYAKFKMKLVSGTALPFYCGQSVTSGKSFTFTPNTDERWFEGTFLADSTNDSLKIYTIAEANGSVYELDSVEVKIITNSVTNGTFADGTGYNILETATTARDDVKNLIRYTNATTTTALVFASGLRTYLGRRYVITYQLDSVNSGSFKISLDGGVNGTARTTAGIYSDTLLSLADNANIYAGRNVAPLSCLLDNVHIYEIPAYFAQSTTTNNHSVGWSKIDALTGAGDTTSTKIIASARGDSVWKNVKIASGVNTFHGIGTADIGKKFILEAWGRAKTSGTKLLMNPIGSGTDSTDLSIVSGTFTKCVYNFVAAAACDTIKFWLSAADTCFIDSVQLKQAKDFIVNGWFYSRGTSGDKPVMWNKYVTTNAAKGYGYYINNTTLTANISDSINTSSGLTATIALNTWNMISLSFNWTGSCSLYVNGVYASSAVVSGIGSFGKRPFNLGWDNSTGRFNGLIGEHQIIQFDNLASSNWATSTPLSIYNAYTLGNGFTNTYSGGTPRASIWLDWLDGTSTLKMVHDLSGNGYDLDIYNNVTNADQSRWKR